jgi:hypothetical protein
MADVPTELSAGLSNLSQGLLKYLDRLATGYQVPVIDDDGRHRVNALRLVELLAFTHLYGKFIRVQNPGRPNGV